MENQFEEIVELLEGIVGDMSAKPKVRLLDIISTLKISPADPEHILKIQDELEYFSNGSNIGSYARTEIMNVISELELLL